MKYLFATAALVGAAFAQTTLSDLPACGQVCINNMLGQAKALGCPNLANGQPDAACLCANADFGYGVRDCVIQSCPAGTDTNSIIAFGLSYCASVSGTGTLAATSALTAAGTATGPGRTATGAGGVSVVAVTTKPIVTTIVSGGSTVTSTIGSTTIFSTGGAGAGGSGTANGGSGTATGTATGGSGGAGGSHSSIPITTEAEVTKITSGGSTITSTIGSTTIFGYVTTITSGGSTITSTVIPGATVTTITSGGSTFVSTILPAITGGAGVSASSIAASASSVIKSANASASSVGASASSKAASIAKSASSVAHSATNAAGSAAGSAGSAASSATSQGGAFPMATMAVNGLAGVAGLAAMLVL